MTWRPDATCAPHDHGAARGTIHLVSGAIRERVYRATGHGLEIVATAIHCAPAVLTVPAGCIHDMTALGEALTIHHYAPRVHAMRIWDVAGRRTLTVGDDCGAWVPRDGAGVVASVGWDEPGGQHA
jgi:cysteine dioxygenase